MDPLVLTFLLGAAFVAAFVDSIVGGGGIISLPALLAVGFPPHLALGTNKLAATGASFTAALRYTQAGLVVASLSFGFIPLAIIGSMAGAATVLHVEARFVKAVVVAVMALMTLYVMLRPAFGHIDKSRPFQSARIAAMSGMTFAIALDSMTGSWDPGPAAFSSSP